VSKILVTGMAGSLAQLTADRLLEQGHQVIGVDYRERPAHLRPDIPFYKGNYNKTRFEDVIRREKPDGLMHLGRVGNLKIRVGKRFDLNVVGTGKVMELSLKYGVKRLLVLSTFHIYGAHAHNHIPIFEDEPLRAGSTFPEIADAVQLDNMAQQWVYRHRQLRTVVVRPCNVIGPGIRNAISRFLRRKRLPYVAGFSPMWQFVHQSDMVTALTDLFHSDEVGTFNVAGAGAIPIVDALSITGAQTIPVPNPLASAYMTLQQRFGRGFPPYLLEFLKYPCVISDEKLRTAIGYQPKVGIEESILTCVRDAARIH